MVGTAEKNVGPARSTVVQKVAASNRSAMNVEPPARSGDTTLTMIPLTWKSGRTSIERVPPVIWNQVTMSAAVALSATTMVALASSIWYRASCPVRAGLTGVTAAPSRQAANMLVISSTRFGNMIASTPSRRSPASASRAATADTVWAKRALSSSWRSSAMQAPAGFRTDRSSGMAAAVMAVPFRAVPTLCCPTLRPQPPHAIGLASPNRCPRWCSAHIPRDWPADGCPPEPSGGRFFVPAPRCRGAARVLTLPSRRAKRCPLGGSMTAAGSSASRTGRVRDDTTDQHRQWRDADRFLPRRRRRRALYQDPDHPLRPEPVPVRRPHQGLGAGLRGTSAGGAAAVDGLHPVLHHAGNQRARAAGGAAPGPATGRSHGGGRPGRHPGPGGPARRAGRRPVGGHQPREG